MNKKRFGSLSVRHWAMIFALAALTAAYVTRSDGSGLMAATTTRELPVYNVDTEEKVLSISFDAAWGNANTEGILNILDQYGVKTNFFLVGFWAEKYPELVAELQARGHEVGNHSATHPHMSKLSDSQIREELKRCSDLVQSITGKPTTLFRPPYGEYNDEVVRISREEGYECIQWNVDSLDWKNISAEDMVRRCTKNVIPATSCSSITIPSISCKRCRRFLNTISGQVTGSFRFRSSCSKAKRGSIMRAHSIRPRRRL